MMTLSPPAGESPAAPEPTPGADAERIFSCERTFENLGLHPRLLKGLEEKGFVHPTDIQARLIPLVLEGRDVLGQAKTGTGKTAAFGLPLLEKVEPKGGHQALVLVPTRELAVQVRREMHDLAKHSNVRITAIYGGERRRTQIDRLARGSEIVIGTPGRVMDLHQDGKFPFTDIRFVVLDEVDRMLDIGFRDDIRYILSRMDRPHQTVFVSATISDEIERLARSFMRDPEKIVSVSGSLTVSQVQQSHLLVERWDKKRLLLHLLEHEDPALTLVFCGTKREVEYLAEFLQKHDIDVRAIHGDMYQRKRDRVMKRLREGGLSVLVASDLAARGLDVQGITHVVNYDMPPDPEVYVHRIGRTARLGADGVAWSFVTPGEGKLLTAIERLINREVPRIHYDDFEPGPVPAKVHAERKQEAERNELERLSRSRTLPAKVAEKDASDETKFPGGIVPTAPPTRRMGGRMRGRR